MSTKQYDGYKVFRYIPTSKEDLVAIMDLAEERNEGVIFLNKISEIGQPVDVMVLPALQERLLEAMRKRGVEATVLVENTSKSGTHTRKRYSHPHETILEAEIRLNNKLNNNDTNDYLKHFDGLANSLMVQMNENMKISATVHKFQFLVGNDKLDKHKQMIYLTEKMTVPNHSCAEITANFTHSKQLEQTFKFTFLESLSFISSVKFVGCKVPLKYSEALNFTIDDENLFSLSEESIQVTHSCESRFAVSNSVRIPPYKCVEILVYVNWLKQLETPFSAEITLTAGSNGLPRNDNGERELGTTTTNLAYIEQALRACKFNGKILRATPDGNGLDVSVKGIFRGDYGLGTVFSVQDALDPLMTDIQDQEHGFQNDCVYQIVSITDNKAMELFGGDKNDGAKVVTLEKNHRETQHWKAVAKGNAFQLQSTIQETKQLKALTNDAVNNKVLHSYCNEGDLLQKWITQKVGRDRYIIINCANEKCLTSKGHGLSVTTEAVMGPHETQLWKIIEV